MTPEIRERIGAQVRGENHPLWKGGQWTSNEGRVFVRVPDEHRHLNPTMRRDGYIQRYQYVWNMAHPEDPVMPGDVIHHIDEDRTNDVIENLEKTTQSKHAREHGLGRKHTAESRALMCERQRERRAREQAERSG